MRIVLLASSQSGRSVHTEAWCKLTLIVSAVCVPKDLPPGVEQPHEGSLFQGLPEVSLPNQT